MGIRKTTGELMPKKPRSTDQTVLEWPPVQEAVRKRLLRSRARGAELEPPKWLGKSIEALRCEVLDRRYPCYFGTIAERKGDMYYTWVDSWDAAHLLTTLPQFAAIAQSADKKNRRTTFAVLFEPEPGLDHNTMRERFWSVMQFLGDHDPRPVTGEAHSDPSDPLWMFTFDGDGYFVFAASPTYSNRRSRNLGPSFAVLFQPRNAFTGIEGDTTAGKKARTTIRRRLGHWDALPPHSELKDFGDPDGREWKQAVLPDDESKVAGRCPLRFDHGPEADLPASTPTPAAASRRLR